MTSYIYLTVCVDIYLIVIKLGRGDQDGDDEQTTMSDIGETETATSSSEARTDDDDGDGSDPKRQKMSPSSPAPHLTITTGAAGSSSGSLSVPLAPVNSSGIASGPADVSAPREVFIKDPVHLRRKCVMTDLLAGLNRIKSLSKPYLNNFDFKPYITENEWSLDDTYSLVRYDMTDPGPIHVDSFCFIRPCKDDHEALKIEAYGVDPKQHRKGLGSEIVRASLRAIQGKAAQSGIKRVLARVADSNVGSIRCLEHVTERVLHWGFQNIPDPNEEKWSGNRKIIITLPQDAPQQSPAPEMMIT